MGFFEKLGVGGAAALMALVVRASYLDARETARRRNSPLTFEPHTSAIDFAWLAAGVGKATPRVIETRVTGMTVEIEVRSSSGLTTWEAEIDFNDYGRLTGNYWLSSGNEQSSIPEYFADRLQAKVRERISTGL